jgi:hypothetical protein
MKERKYINYYLFSADIDSSSLTSNKTEALVYLPASVTRVPRRVSFVAFRNPLAFRSDLAVNSRIFSVNVENITHFGAGEVKCLNNVFLNCETIVDD